jgi:type IV secretory pathway VirJ component
MKLSHHFIRWKPIAVLLFAVLAIPVATAFAAPREIKVTNDTAGEVTVLAPKEEPKLFVLYISGIDGITPERRQEAERFVARGAAVALIDLPDLKKKVTDSDDADCHYTFGDFEDISHLAERDLGMTAWRWPVMVGIGEGATLAYLTTAQAPENTAAGGVSIGMQTSSYATRLTMCGVKEAKNENGVRTYLPSAQIRGHWTLITAEQPASEIAAFADAAPTAKLRIVPGDLSQQIDAAVEEAFEIGGAPQGPLAGLPVVELPAKGKIRGLAVFISGDGGWRDIDKQIAEYLSERGIGIVGIDSLRYFWSRKEPSQIAADVSRVVSHYTKLWQVRKVTLAGYSLGANVIPFLWDKFDKTTQNEVQAMVLLGLEPTAEFEITVQGWLGMSTSTEVDVRPSLATLPPAKVMCFYGTKEKDDNETACVYPELAEAQIIERPGGHHFDGDYKSVAQMIYDRIVGKVTG